MSLLESVIEVVSNILKVSNADLNEKSGLGATSKWDSLNHTNIVLELEEVFDVDFDFDELDKIVSIEKIIISLEGKGVKVDL
jgi:acyl carrier protein